MKVVYLQDAKVEFTLSVGSSLDTLVLLCRGDELQQLSSYGIEYGECEVVPVNNDGKVMPGLAGEWGGEQYIQIVIQDLEILCVSRRKVPRWIGER